MGAQAPEARTRNPHGTLQFGCQDCHAAESWKPMRARPEFNHDRATRYPLRGLHAGVDCTSCHLSPVFKKVGSQCADCHADVHRRQFGADCAKCHSVKGWQITRVSTEHVNRFPLQGAHALADCEACHRGAAAGSFTGLSVACVSCHRRDYDSTSSINHRSAGFSTACELCHGVEVWQGARFDHDQLTRFPLAGAHARLECFSCHSTGTFKGTPANCVECHVKDYSATANPPHASAGLPRECALCHSTASWQGAKFDHQAMTRFALTGAHVNVSCDACHVAGRFSGTATACFSCHVGAYEQTTNPDHRRGGFPTSCESCHSTATWQGATFDHNAGRFPLTGAHVSVVCSDCHRNNQFTGTAQECVACHLEAFNRTVNPNHVAAGFDKNCAACHSTQQWSGARFDHNRTRFPLTGAHTNVACQQCHQTGTYVGTTTQCIGCHRQDFQITTSPPHVAANFPENCTLCHSTAQWKGASYDHNTATRFALTGAHQSVGCLQCHVNNRFLGTPQDCMSCHLDTFNRTSHPNHAAAGFPRTCETCHSTVSWSGARFDHSAATRFPLTGAHLNASCLQCHAGDRFAGTPTDCASCHLDAYQRTVNPNHTAAGFSRDCSLCHSTSQWRGARFDHSTTRFPLTGAHSSITCSSCHRNGTYAGLDSSCVSCHLDAYTATTNPNHVAANFPRDCQVCHSTAQWRGAVFDHSRTRFPLTGAHLSVQCVSCHVGGRYAGTPVDCYSCHRIEYETVTNPNHLSAGFPRTCETCHTTITWSGARFEHRFPIYSGAHQGKWTTCNDCHTNPTNYAVFSCTNCHEHSQSRMDEKHRQVGGYVYNSVNCYSCHPQGKH
ncbi:MAG: hypothetical protein AB1898_13450 [Acidobacteriota bacterium]